MKDLYDRIKDEFDKSDDKQKFLYSLREFLFSISPQKSQPVDFIRWVSIKDVVANDYNPNSVASSEMGLLYVSIKHDGYTQPIVTIYDPKKKKYVIVDGFHRYYVAKSCPDILERNNGLLPVVVIDKSINDRMASTIRHNRARGAHSVNGMSSLVFNMLDNGWHESDICNELGMEPEEVLKLKHITGFAKLFENTEYSRAWKSKRQAFLERKVKQEKLAGEV